MPNDEIEEIAAPLGRATIRDRIAAFEMLDRMSDATQAQKCMRLAIVGFSRKEIAELLMTSVQTVSQNIYSEKQKAKKPTKKAAK
jgi:DNA-binding CsgD family transcriptional regulator